ncbi:MAG: hypothetical protein V4727_07210 [Verrucomicrobiota bacterium]
MKKSGIKFFVFLFFISNFCTAVLVFSVQMKAKASYERLGAKYADAKIEVQSISDAAVLKGNFISVLDASGEADKLSEQSINDLSNAFIIISLSNMVLMAGVLFGFRKNSV